MVPEHNGYLELGGYPHLFRTTDWFAKHQTSCRLLTRYPEQLVVLEGVPLVLASWRCVFLAEGGRGGRGGKESYLGR